MNATATQPAPRICALRHAHATQAQANDCTVAAPLPALVREFADVRTAIALADTYDRPMHARLDAVVFALRERGALA